MKAYFDTGVLLKIYIHELNSNVADALVLASDGPIPLTHFHEIEIRTALRLKLARKEISVSELAAALRNFQLDITEGRLVKPTYDLVAVFLKAEELSARYAAETMARSLDILHVAAALILEVTEFISLDERQRMIARDAGLKVSPD